METIHLSFNLNKENRMTKPRRAGIVLVSLLAALAFFQVAATDDELKSVPGDLKVGFDSITVADSMNYLTFLSADELEGRDTASRGLKIARLYIESLYKSWGMDIIGMTNMPEARLAREAEMCFATLAMVTDYDCWHTSEDVTVDIIVQNLMKNSKAAKDILKNAISAMPGQRNCACGESLKDAIITARDAIPNATKKKLDIIIGKYLK